MLRSGLLCNDRELGANGGVNITAGENFGSNVHVGLVRRPTALHCGSCQK